MNGIKGREKNFENIVEQILDKGIVIDSKARLDLVANKLLGLRALLTLSSFETADQINKKMGYSLPSSIDKKKWRKANRNRCPQCGKKIKKEEGTCPFCGFTISNRKNKT